ncbi:histone deacetylase family protein [Parahaliea aestuarii]|uniref:Histone deacetylase family protein n=1 Tax=Parahaliea aestuarii TaxID=1852021 RepID=A0A5C8ZP39_9GAMM|nr:histone deacetylase family protein [Parahaliea aestuarii]TXS90005.1 histone deacetylase family protein [Parahaliea aestuarii]
MTIAYITHPECLQHEMGPHPEQPARLNAINDRLLASGLDVALRHYEAPAVERDLLERVHDNDYIQSLYLRSPTSGHIQLDEDTAMNPHTLSAALHAAGAAQLGVDLVMSGAHSKAFCAVRPPGHHAERARAMGFCLFNNVVVGAYRALRDHGLQRVAILDFDVHHGNGTENIVAGDERILFCSTFQHPLYPYSGSGPSAGNVVNTPLPTGSDGAALRTAVERDWLPRLADFAPQLLLVSAGFDAHQADDMAGLNFVDSDYAWVTRRLCEQADASAGGRLVSCLEGGYHLLALGRCVEAHLKAMLGAT